jgi:hypothetical protein
VPLERFVVVTAIRPDAATLEAEGLELLREELNVLDARFESVEDRAEFPEAEYVVREIPGGRAYLSRSPTPELAREGLVRETLRRLQQARKEARLEYTDRIGLELWASPALAEALEGARGRLERELLADGLELRSGEPPEGTADVRTWTIDGELVLAARMRRMDSAGPAASGVARRAAVPPG